MIICICKEVSDRTIKSMLDQGIDSFKAVQNFCGAGRGCGKCVPTIKTLINEGTGLHRRERCVRTDASYEQIKEFSHGKSGKRTRNH